MSNANKPGGDTLPRLDATDVDAADFDAADIDGIGVAGDRLDPDDGAEPASPARRGRISRGGAVAVGILPVVALLAVLAAGLLQVKDAAARNAEVARIESVQAATEGTLKMLSYAPETVEQQLGSAIELMTGALRDSYGAFTRDVVIPGAKDKKITAVATVPAAASVSVNGAQAVALVFVNQITTVGTEPPTNLVSSVRVTLSKVGGRWLMSEFTPV